jgi:hypothetical protein
LPLADAFYDFHVTANNAYVGQYRQLAEEIRGKPLTLSVNSGLSNAQALAIAPQLTYFCCEVPQHAASLTAATHPIYIYKLGEGLQRPIASTASGQDWAYVSERNKPCLVRTWIALSYALGHNFMAPHRQWCYTKEKGTHWYTGSTKEYAYMYQFVREHAALLDRYEAVAPVAVVYDNAADRRYRGKIEPICVDLARRNIPFRVVIAGDTWLDYHLSASQLAGFRAVIATRDRQWMNDADSAVLDAVKADGRLISWPDEKTLGELVPAPIAVKGSKYVQVVPRAVPDDVNSPVVLHLLNLKYDGQRDAMQPQEEFTLRVRRDLWGQREFTKAMLHAPQQESMSLQLRWLETHVEVDVPRLTLWGLLELK